MPRIPKALTIGGADSSSASGVQADLLMFAALDVVGLSVLTTVMAANTIEITAIAEVPVEVVIAQIDTVAEDIGADALKLGVLSSTVLVENIGDRLEAWGIPHTVLDPVMLSQTGIPLLQDTALGTLVRDILPLTEVLICGPDEASSLSGRTILAEDHMERAARHLRQRGPSIVIIRGEEHRNLGATVISDSEGTRRLELLFPARGHGSDVSGLFSAAITAFLALDVPVNVAIDSASSIVRALLHRTLSVGSGQPIFDLRFISLSRILEDIHAPGRA